MNSEQLLAFLGMRVLLDTNVIMRMEDAKTESVRGALRSFVKNNDVCICDTVMYELLRNLNAKRFRERHELLRLASLNCLSEGTTAVQTMYERLNWLYLSVLRREPWNYLHRRNDDLWIIAAGLANGISQFLITDASADFLPQLFKTRRFILDPKCTVCLHEFQNNRASEEWKKLEGDERCDLILPKGYLDKIKVESWRNRIGMR